MPHEAVAGSDRLDGCVAVVNGEVQRSHRVASGDIGTCVGGCVGGSGINCTMPCIGVADRGRFDGGVVVVDGECQCVGAIGIGAAGSVGGSMPCVAFASGDVCGGTMVDGEMQRRHRVASHYIDCCVGRGVGAGGVLCAMPHEAVASSDRLDGRVAVVNGEVQRRHRVASGDIGTRVGRSVG